MSFELPPSAPRAGNAFTRWLGRSVLRLGGWRLEGRFPDLPKLVIIAAPHSSAWDAIWGIAAKLALGLHIEFMAKKEAFWWPLGPILRALGGVPTDRRAPNGVVGQMVQRFAAAERLWLVLAPEGTRRRVERWKSGFWQIAHDAEVPVFCAYFHYPERTIGLGVSVVTTADRDADIAAIRAWYRPWRGKHRGTE